MGVIFGLEIARAYVEGGRSDELGIEVISFIDEEGRFAGLLGSAAFTGRVDESDIGKLKDERGEKLESALQAAGYDGRELLRCEPGRHAAYLEAHIEQGPVLETAGRKIGLVTDIVGVARCEVVFTGQADHAGTTPMELRRDAAAALYAFADDFARSAAKRKRPDRLEPGDRGDGPGRLQRGDPSGPVGRRVSRSFGFRNRPHPAIHRRKRGAPGEAPPSLDGSRRGREHPSEPYGRILAAPPGVGRRRPGRIQHANAERRRTRRHDAGATDSLRDDVRAEHRRPQPRTSRKIRARKTSCWD